MLSWKPFLSRVVVGALVVGTAVGAGVFVGVRLASATPGGRTRDALTYSGVLHGAAAGAHALTFTFQKPGATCGPTTVMATVATGGAFSVNVPIDACPAFFDGDDVTYSVAEGADVLATGVQINPVPHARFADQAGVSNACPAGYGRVTGDTTVLGGAGVVLCRRGRDEVVKVGDGASAFWIDRYESTVWANREATGSPINSDGDALAAMMPSNGMWSSPAGERPRPPAFAASVGGGVRPARNVTWFQASALCRASGKQLPSGEEWLRAAHGTPDDESRCHIAMSNTLAQDTNLGARCFSLWGAQDMIGNVWEWTGEWYASVGQVTTAPDGGAGELAGRRVLDGRDVWGPGFGSDGTWNISSVVLNTGDNQIGIPGAVMRGGDWSTGSRAGVFAMAVYYGPAARSPSLGFRCIMHR